MNFLDKRLLRNACAAIFGLSALCSQANAAQTCKIDDKTVFMRIGQAQSAGDLRIKAMEFIQPENRIIIDIKAPGFEQRGQNLNRERPVSFNICGKEVTLALSVLFNGEAVVNISVF
ncbi:hypothetical protein AB870_06850 [Pandoraea faecigallinarum]|uniref:Uncharacterized protein n=1 Tax=Pandoraea faecigallinarum TaxID=656179 RepID=A0A0H3WTM8_9BURK|nr:hypothetical protein [Pandoraea faecigallinarum]AKM29891.1 hypothetical protein AB870_06850 [Pandoraea faecigallinarum]